MSPKTKKRVSRKNSPGAISHDALLLRVSILETQVRDLRHDLAPTVALRENLAEQIRLSRKLRQLRGEAEEAIVKSAPPKRAWWQNWWDALFLATVNRTVSNISSVTNVATIDAEMREAE